MACVATAQQSDSAATAQRQRSVATASAHTWKRVAASVCVSCHEAAPGPIHAMHWASYLSSLMPHMRTLSLLIQLCTFPYRGLAESMSPPSQRSLVRSAQRVPLCGKRRRGEKVSHGDTPCTHTTRLPPRGSWRGHLINPINAAATAICHSQSFLSRLRSLARVEMTSLAHLTPRVPPAPSPSINHVCAEPRESGGDTKHRTSPIHRTSSTGVYGAIR